MDDIEMDVISESFANESTLATISEKSFREQTDSWWNLAHQAKSNKIESIDVGGSKSLPSHSGSRTSNRVFNSHSQDVWDLSESVMELYEACQRRENLRSLRRDARDMLEKQDSIDVQSWLAQSDDTGFIRVYFPLDGSRFKHSRLIPCTVETTAQQICQLLGISVNALYVQLNGDIIERVESDQVPLLMQNNYLMTLGFESMRKVKEEGLKEDLGFLIRFYAGKPAFEGTLSRSQLQAWLEVRKGRVMQQWVHRMCVLYGTRLLLYKEKTRRSDPSTLQLARGIVEQGKVKGRDLCLKLTSTIEKAKIIYLSFHDQREYEKWYIRCKKATDKLPTSADLSNCHLEYMPDNIFVNDQLTILNLRHNVLKERPSDAAHFPITIGWLDDLARFSKLRSLNLADNGLDNFPIAICSLSLLAELNLASNKLTEIPGLIGNLTNLRALHLHNNHLSSLPDELINLKKLFVLVLAFNRFVSIPSVTALMTDIRHSEMDKLILAGNQISMLSEDVLIQMKYVKKLDLRLNLLTLLPSETGRFSYIDRLTHLDIRDNCVSEELDLRCLTQLIYLNCERNNIMSLQLTGGALKILLAAQNSLERLCINPQPEQLVQLDLSDNFLQALPDWLDECSCLQLLKANNNQLVSLPQRLFCDLKKLRTVHLDHNFIEALPREIDTLFIEEIYLHCNFLTMLPPDFLRKANKLKILNVSKNCLAGLPPPSESGELNKLRELYLSMNCLGDNCMETITAYTRLRLLHLAYNEIHFLYEKDLKHFEMLEEINISANQLQSLPTVLGEMPKLSVLRAHSNYLTSLPGLSKATSLKVLDVGHNNLVNISLASLLNSQLYLLDMSMNRQLRVDLKDLKTVKHTRKGVCLVDTTGQGRQLPGLKRQDIPTDEDQTDPSMPWKVGFSETAGSRNKLCVKLLKMVKFRTENEALFGMFDGGYNDEVPKLLVEKMPQIVGEELQHSETSAEYMKYSFLSAHRQLRVSGQRVGASAVLCHMKRIDKSSKKFSLQIANVGDVEAVLCRQDDAVVLTRKFTTIENREECYRVCLSDGIIMEDGRVEGLYKTTRQIGAAFLYPHSMPDPFVCEVQLHHDDEFLIIANRTVWNFLSYAEAVEAVYEIGNPVIAAKKIQDLVQAYGCQENISVLVIRFNTERGPSLARLRPTPRPMSIDDVEAAAQFDAARRRKQMKRALAAKMFPEEQLHVDSQVNVSHDVWPTDSNRTLVPSVREINSQSYSVNEISINPFVNPQSVDLSQNSMTAGIHQPISVDQVLTSSSQNENDLILSKAKKEMQNLEVLSSRAQKRYAIAGEGDIGDLSSNAALSTLKNNAALVDALFSATDQNKLAVSSSEGGQNAFTTFHSTQSDVSSYRVSELDMQSSFDASIAQSNNYQTDKNGSQLPSSQNLQTQFVSQPVLEPPNLSTKLEAENVSDNDSFTAGLGGGKNTSYGENISSHSTVSGDVDYLNSADFHQESLFHHETVPSSTLSTHDSFTAGINSGFSSNFLSEASVLYSTGKSSNNSIVAGTSSKYNDKAFANKNKVEASSEREQTVHKKETQPVNVKSYDDSTPMPANVELKPVSTHKFVRRDDLNRWNNLLQGRLSEEVKSFEQKQAENDASVPTIRSSSYIYDVTNAEMQIKLPANQPQIIVSEQISENSIYSKESDTSLLNVKATIHLFENIGSRDSGPNQRRSDLSLDGEENVQKLPSPSQTISKRTRSASRSDDNSSNKSQQMPVNRNSSMENDYHYDTRGRLKFTNSSSNSSYVSRHSSYNLEAHASLKPSKSPILSEKIDVNSSETQMVNNENMPSPHTVRQLLEARARTNITLPVTSTLKRSLASTSQLPPVQRTSLSNTSAPSSFTRTSTEAQSLVYHYEQIQFDGGAPSDNVIVTDPSSLKQSNKNVQMVQADVHNFYDTTSSKSNVKSRSASAHPAVKSPPSRSEFYVTNNRSLISASTSTLQSKPAEILSAKKYKEGIHYNDVLDNQNAYDRENSFSRISSGEMSTAKLSQSDCEGNAKEFYSTVNKVRRRIDSINVSPNESDNSLNFVPQRLQQATVYNREPGNMEKLKTTQPETQMQKDWKNRQVENKAAQRPTSAGSLEYRYSGNMSIHRNDDDVVNFSKL